MSKTLEDYAVAAMNALVIAGLNSGAWEDYDDLAKSAFMIAESMIKERNKLDNELINKSTLENESALGKKKSAYVSQTISPKINPQDPFLWLKDC